MTDKKSQAPKQPDDMVIYREGVFQRLHLCEYLRELTEGQAEEAAKTDAANAREIDPAS